MDSLFTRTVRLVANGTGCYTYSDHEAYSSLMSWLAGPARLSLV